MVPSSAVVGRPEVAPTPAAEATPVSLVPLGVLEPAAAAPPAALPPAPPVRASRRPRWVFLVALAPVAAVAPVAPPAPPMKVEMAAAASTGPALVRPRAEALPPISRARMMAVSCSEPQPGVGQSRGVPSCTVMMLEMVWKRVRKMLTGKTRHVHAIGTLDLSDDTVGLNGSGDSSNESN
jgi:hypothetical protein